MAFTGFPIQTTDIGSEKDLVRASLNLGADILGNETINEILAVDTNATLTALDVYTLLSNNQLTAAQIMSKVGEQLIASLRTARPFSDGLAYFATTCAKASIALVRTSTGYARLLNSDNTLGDRQGIGDPNESIILEIPPSGLHRALAVMPVGENGTNYGNINIIDIESSNITSLSTTGLFSLTDLFLFGNQLTTFSAVGLTALESLNISDNNLTSESTNATLVALDGAGLSYGWVDISVGNAAPTGAGLVAAANLILKNWTVVY